MKRLRTTLCELILLLFINLLIDMMMCYISILYEGILENPGNEIFCKLKKIFFNSKKIDGTQFQVRKL